MPDYRPENLSPGIDLKAYSIAQVLPYQPKT
jgi:hypothetical protein